MSLRKKGDVLSFWALFKIKKKKTVILEDSSVHNTFKKHLLCAELCVRRIQR